MVTTPTHIRIDTEIKQEASSYSQKTLDTMAESRPISRDPDIKGYYSMKDLKAAHEEI
ncbi:hypothetical protein [uncultured Dubosiella sp.]|uniref:hypothetical protein n=1 Tax=uncultured Dubosiella sp. TaxID=1937011 RepID=UPI0025929F19|nr:hypothetical protein [uncultured Dubosiella sp.]